MVDADRGLRKDVPVMKLQNDGKQMLQFCNQFVQEWVASVSAGAGVKHDLFWISSELAWLHCFGLFVGDLSQLQVNQLRRNYSNLTYM